MDNKDITYEKIVEVIKSTSPHLEDPENLSGIILKRIDQSSGYERKNKLILVSSPILGIAASFLICLICWNYFDLFRSKQYKIEFSSYHLESELVEKKATSYAEFSEDNSLSENIKSFSSLVREKQENKIKRAQLYNILSNSNK